MLATGCGISSIGPTLAQTYPSRPIKMICPFGPGGSDVVARILADRLSSSLGQPVIVENRPGGAGGTVGAKSVAVAEPDGYALLYSTPGPLVVGPSVYKDIGYDPAKSFTPIATVFSSPHMLVVHPGVPATSMRELAAYARANPGKLSFASPGYGTLPHLLGEMFRLMSGVDIVHVPYKALGQIVPDVLSGQVQIYFGDIALFRPHVEAGKLRPLAVADEARSAFLPDVPTTIESGFPKLQSTFWTGVLAPAGTPASIVNKLNAAINDALTSTEVEASLRNLSAIANISSPQGFATFIAAETQKWTEVARAAAITRE